MGVNIQKGKPVPNEKGGYVMGFGATDIDRLLDKSIVTLHSIPSIYKESINEDIEELLSIKKKTMEVIKEVGQPDCQMVLEMRYLCFKTWEAIAIEIGCSVQNVHILHSKALDLVKVPEN